MRESARLRLITVAVTLGIIFGFSLIFGSNPIMFVIGLWNIFATAFVWLFSGGIIVYAIVLAIFLGLVYPFAGVAWLFKKTTEWSDKYTNLPKLSNRNPLSKKAFYLIYIPLNIFFALSLIGVIPIIFIKVFGYIYAVWLLYIIFGWLSKGGIKEHSDELTLIAKFIGIIGGIFLLFKIPDIVITYGIVSIFFGGLLFGLFDWIKKRNK